MMTQAHISAVKFVIKAQAHLSSYHVIKFNTSTSVPIMYLMTAQTHLIMLLVITQAQPSSHHVTYDNTSPHHHPSVALVTQAHTPSHTYAPYRRSSQFFTKLLPVTLHIPLMFSYNTHTKYSSHRGTIIDCRPRGLTSFNSTCS